MLHYVAHDDLGPIKLPCFLASSAAPYPNPSPLLSRPQCGSTHIKNSDLHCVTITDGGQFKYFIRYAAMTYSQTEMSTRNSMKSVKNHCRKCWRSISVFVYETAPAEILHKYWSHKLYLNEDKLLLSFTKHRTNKTSGVKHFVDSEL